MKHSERAKILVLGNRQIDDAPFEQRGLILQKVTIEQLDDNELTNCARGVLLAPPEGKFKVVSSYFEARFLRMCELGLVTAVYITKGAVQVSQIRDAAYWKSKVGEDIDDSRKRLRWIDSLPWVYLGESEWAIAETLARHDPGPPLGTPVIVTSEIPEPLGPETETMLKRAFYDADRITVKRLTGGRVAKETFCVFANLAGADFGPQPMPFFLKLGAAWKIEDEKRNYRKLAEPFIPFHLRPSLNEVRSVQTLTSAALACNFVESAIPLRAALQTDQAHGVIFSLFEVTLRGLRMHTLNSPKKAGVIEAFLDSRVRAAEIETQHPSRIEQLRKRGLTQKPQEVEQALRKYAKKVMTQEGHYHGDLHFGNIMARNRDAIVIDFGSMGPFGPLYADPAILEVSLVFGTDNHDKPQSFDDWRNFVDSVYLDPLSPPVPKGDHPQFGWLHKALRELRHVVACCGVEQTEALIILAGCLLRYGRNAPLKLENAALDTLAENRRAYALVVAYKIAERLDELHAAR